MFRFLIGLFFTLSFGASPGFAQATLANDVESYLTTTFGTEREGVSALIVRDGEALYRGAIGYDVLADKKALSPDQPFQIGSVTKPFVAATILRLAEKGQLDLDDSVAQYLPAIVEDDRITVRHLLTHTSGLVRHYPASPLDMVKDDKLWTTNELLEFSSGQEMLFEPGQSQMYSGVGYVWLGGVIEAVTGRPWHEVVDDEVLAPVGIDSIYFQPERAKIEGMVTGYMSNSEIFAPDARYYVYQDSNAGLVGTLDGLAEWFIALFEGRIISPSSLALMTNPVPRDAGGSGSVAAGLMTAQVRDVKGFLHSGRVPGYATVAMYFPEHNLFVGTFSNDDATDPPLQPATIMLAAMALDTPFGSGRSNASRAMDRDQWFGEYQSGGRSMQYVDRAEVGQLFEYDDGTTEPLAWMGNGVLLGPDTGRRWAVLDVDIDGTPVIRWHVTGADAVMWRRTGDAKVAATVNLTPQQANTLAGVYQLPIGPFEVEAAQDGSVRVHPPGLGWAQTTAVSPSRLIVEEIGIAVVFTMGSDGRAESISISMGDETLEGKRTD